MLRTTQKLERFNEFRVWFNPFLVSSRWKYYPHRREIYRANWTGRPGKMTQPINWDGTRRPVNSHPNASQLKFQRDYSQSSLAIENLKQPDSFVREIQHPDVTTMDGILPRYIDMPYDQEQQDFLKGRIRKNRSTNRYLDEEWKHAKNEREKFSWLHFESSNPKIFFDVYDVMISSFDRNRVEHFHDYVFKTARYLGINIEESYTLPNELHKYSVYDANNNLQNTDSLTKHYRIVQMRDIDMIQLSTLSTFLRETVPASVEVEISKHDSEVHNRRYVKRGDIEAAQKELELLKMIK